MSIGTLWTIPTQHQGIIIRAAAAYGGLELTVENVELGTTNKTKEFTAKFPMGQIPAFETPTGFYLSESTAIARYVAKLAKNSTLLGSGPEEAALVDQWVSFATWELWTYGVILKYMLSGSTPYTKQADTSNRDKISRSLAVLEAHLATRTYLVNERITLGDITMAVVLKLLISYLIDAPRRATLPNIMRFYETVSNHPAIKPVFGEKEYAEKAQQFTPPPKAKKEAAK